MGRSTYWYITIAYFICVGLMQVANAIMAATKSGNIEVPWIFTNTIIMVLAFLLPAIGDFIENRVTSDR